MGDGIIFLIGLILLFIGYCLVYSFIENEANKRASIRLDKFRSELESEYKQKEERLDIERNTLNKNSSALKIMVQEKTQGFPWLADAWADYLALADEDNIKYLKNKKRPALKAAQVVNAVKSEKRQLVRENKILNFTLKFYESMFPWCYC